VGRAQGAAALTIREQHPNAALRLGVAVRLETTESDSYGTGKYEKCADCMAHCGYEGTAVDDTMLRPWKALKVALFGIRTEGSMAPTSRSIRPAPPNTCSRSRCRNRSSAVACECRAVRSRGGEAAGEAYGAVASASGRLL
jgi:Domain of unknown function (DUF3463)